MVFGALASGEIWALVLHRVFIFCSYFWKYILGTLGDAQRTHVQKPSLVLYSYHIKQYSSH